MIRRKKLAVAGVFVLALGALLSPLAEPPPLESGAYLQAVTGRGAVVCIEVGAPKPRGLVVRRGDAIVARIAADGPQSRHELRVEGLNPATRYDYEVVDEDGERIDGGSFVTRSEDDSRPVRFAMLGDSGGQPWWVDAQEAPLFRLLQAHRWLPIEDEPRATAALLESGTPDFWLHMGDVVYPKGARTHYWTGFFAPFGDTLRRAPCYPVLGNHDVVTADGGPFLDLFVLPGEAGDRMFTFRDGPLRVIGLDLNTPVGADHPAIAFLRETASAATEPWLLVFNHYPVRSVYRERPRADLEEHLVPLCRELGVDLLCAGHDHNYQRYGQPGETIEIVTGGGGKSLYPVVHSPQGLVVAASAYHVCFVTIDGLVLSFVARAVDGTELDAFTIDKAALVRDGRARGSPERLARIEALMR